MGQPDIIHHMMQINLRCITLLKMHPECKLSCFSHVQLFVTLWNVAHQGSPVHGILQARMLEWVTRPSPGDLLDPVIEPVFLKCSALQVGSLPPVPPSKTKMHPNFKYNLSHFCL